MVHLMPLHTKTQPCLASFKSRLVLLFWYQLTQVVLEERPLNGCVCVCDSVMKIFLAAFIRNMYYLT